MAVKRTEVKLVASLLEQEAADTGELATSIITALDEKRKADDTHWCVVYSYAGTMQVLGTFPTKNKGIEAVYKIVSNEGNFPEFGPEVYVKQVRTMESIGESAY